MNYTKITREVCIPAQYIQHTINGISLFISQNFVGRGAAEVCIISILVFLKSKICSVLQSKKSYQRKCGNNFKNLLTFNSGSLVCFFCSYLFFLEVRKIWRQYPSYSCIYIFNVLKNISGSRDFSDPVLCKPLFYIEN